MTDSKDQTINHRVLSLDGGGAKGVYTLGFLSRLEKDIGKPIHEHFDLIYGTSTGAIIAALVSPHQDGEIERTLRCVGKWDPPWKRERAGAPALRGTELGSILEPRTP